jgi:hypothetical protein
MSPSWAGVYVLALFVAASVQAVRKYLIFSAIYILYSTNRLCAHLKSTTVFPFLLLVFP